MGARNRPYYRIVVSDSRRTARAEVLEELGSYDPVVNPTTLRLDRERAQHWIARGARVSPTVASLPRPARARGARRLLMRRLVETIVRRLSDRPDEVRVHEFFEGPTAVYEISVPEADRGRLIGREGRTVRALRGFVGAAAAARGKKAVVRVKD
jgi:ribosomal protein S16